MSEQSTLYRGEGVRQRLIDADRRRAATRKRVIAIGRSVQGAPFVVQAPADWPTPEEIDRICSNVRHLCAPAHWLRLCQPGYCEAREFPR